MTLATEADGVIGIKSIYQAEEAYRKVGVRLAGGEWLCFRTTKWEIDKTTGVLRVEYLLPHPKYPKSSNIGVERKYSPHEWREISTDPERLSGLLND